MEILTQLENKKVQTIFQRYGLAFVALAGSQARGEATYTSDIDLIFEPKAGEKFSLFRIGGLKSDLEEVLQRRVDLVKSHAIRPSIRESLFSHIIPLYHDS